MLRRTGADERPWTDSGEGEGEVPVGAGASAVAAEAQAREVSNPMGDAARARGLQLERLHALWSPSVEAYLNLLGRKTWGAGRYEIAGDVDPDACWREYQVQGLEWHARTDRYRVRNEDDWYQSEYRLGYRLRLEVRGGRYVMANSPLTQRSLRRWFLNLCAEGCLQRVEERLVRLY